MSLERVSILIKTFLRDAHLYETIDAIRNMMPEAQMIIVDDGDSCQEKESRYTCLWREGHKAVRLPFDSGFGAKSNEALNHLTRPYLLIGSDDFNFRPVTVRQGIEKLVAVLDGDPDVDIASGRVNGYPYEGTLEEKDRRVTERYIDFKSPKFVNGVEYHDCDLTVNYSLMRASILGPGKIEWDNDIKIGGGEHGAQFIKIQRAGYKVAYVPGVSVNEQQGQAADPRYGSFRMRASQQQDRPALKRLGINEYVLFGGSVERT